MLIIADLYALVKHFFRVYVAGVTLVLHLLKRDDRLNKAVRIPGGFQAQYRLIIFPIF